MITRKGGGYMKGRNLPPEPCAAAWASRSYAAAPVDCSAIFAVVQKQVKSTRPWVVIKKMKARPGM
jgi:hypothetical protein